MFYDLERRWLIFALIFGICFLGVAFSRSQDFFLYLDKEIYSGALILSYSTGWIRTWEIITVLGRSSFVYPIFSIPTFFLIFQKKDKKSIFVFLILVVAILSKSFLKDFFATARPVSFSLIENPTSYAFPSGHAFNAVLFFLLVPGFWMVLIRKKSTVPFLYKIIYISGLILVCFSRIFLGVHWFSDVLGGVFLGFVFVYLFKYVLHRFYGREFLF